jgi:hypothetical protein
MYHLVPAILVALVYTGFRLYGTRDRRMSRGLVMEALGFAVCSYAVMWVYRKFYLERFDTYGDTCPNGTVRVPDPLNSKQTTCVAQGHQTYPPGNIDALKK